MLAYRSLQGCTFTKLFNLLRTRRLVEVAFDRVMQNEGARTAGVDGANRRTLTEKDNAERLKDEIWREVSSKTYRPSPVRRVYIPKPNGDKRPLGIPTIKDRVVQEMLRLILEPIYECKFYKHSYGFRPYRSTHHAAVRIKDLIGRRNHNWIIEGDIRKCFDRIHHEKLLGIMRRTIKDERIIKMVKQMLKAGVMEDGAWHITDEGTPQGGIISPLLASIYLNELDQFIAEKWDRLTESERNRRKARKTGFPCYIVRYADDFVVTVQGTKEQAEQLKAEIARFLWDELHLELSDEKTLITPVEKGCDFLGFHIQRHRNTSLITPSRKAMKRFRKQVSSRIWEGFDHGDQAGIAHLNRYLIGWGMYYRRVSSKRDFGKADHYVWERVWNITYRLRGERKGLRKHYQKHYISYRYDAQAKNRWRKGGHYGSWLDEKHTRAMIVLRLSFIPIRYVELHPQLNPYVPEERARLDARKTLCGLLAEYQLNEPKVNRQYGPEWGIIRQIMLQDAGFRCQNCGRPIRGREAHVHHEAVKLKEAKSRAKAHKLDGLKALCPKCHAQAERGRKAS